MNSLKSLVLEAIICATVYGFTQNVYLVNMVLFGFAAFHLIEEYHSHDTLTSLKSLTSWAVMGLSIATAYFHTLSFIKWKGSVVLLVTAGIILYSPYLWPQSIGQALLKNVLILDQTEARAINDIMGFFLLWMSVLNLVLVAYYTDSEWAWFKTILLPIVCLAFGVMLFLIYRDRRRPKEQA